MEQMDVKTLPLGIVGDAAEEAAAELIEEIEAEMVGDDGTPIIKLQHAIIVAKVYIS